MKRVRMILAIGALATISACTNMTPQQQGTMSGAGLAAISGGNAWTGAAIGGVAGGVAGNMRGANQ